MLLGLARVSLAHSEGKRVCGVAHALDVGAKQESLVQLRDLLGLPQPVRVHFPRLLLGFEGPVERLVVVLGRQFL